MVNTTWRFLLCQTALFAFFLVYFCVDVQALTNENLGMGNPVALGLAHAVTADPPGIDSIHYNPAGLAKIKGRQNSLKLLAAPFELRTKIGARHLEKALTTDGNRVDDTYFELTGNPYPEDPIENTESYTNTASTTVPLGGMTSIDTFFVPLGGIAIEDPDMGWVFATAVYAPFSSGLRRDKDDPGSYQGIEAAASRVTYLSPSIGFRISDTISFGASLGVSWQGLGIETGMRTPMITLAFIEHAASQANTALEPLDIAFGEMGPYDPIGVLFIEMEDPLSLSFNVGLLWEPEPWISVGMVYQSGSTSSMKGHYKIENDTGDFLALTQSIAAIPAVNSVLAATNGGYKLHGQRVEEGTVEADYHTPSHFALGVSVRVLDNIKVNVDVKHSDYTAAETLVFTFSDSMDFLTIADLIYKMPPAIGAGDAAEPNIMRVTHGYENVWTWAIGTEYQYTDKIAFRAGYEPRTSSISKERFSLTAPAGDADLYTLGLGYQLDYYSVVNIGIGWMHSEYEVAAGESQNANSTLPGRVLFNQYAYLDLEGEADVYLFTLSYDTKF